MNILFLFGLIALWGLVFAVLYGYVVFRPKMNELLERVDEIGHGVNKIHTSVDLPALLEQQKANTFRLSNVEKDVLGLSEDFAKLYDQVSLKSS